MAKKVNAAKAEKKAEHANPYKGGSRKAAIYDTFMAEGGGEDGLKAALKHAARKDVGIKAGTVKSWASAWLKGETRPKPNPNKPPKAERVVKAEDKEFHPLFKFTTRKAADTEHERLCTRAGLRPHAFHVIEDDGKFAVAPAHYKPPGPPPTFSKGDIVYDAFIANTKAKVLEAGPQQTLIRYIKERKTGPREDCVINRFLVKLPEKAEKTKRERL